MKFGIISGTFDPIHAGHLALAQLATNNLELDEVWFVPEKIPRNKQNVTGYDHRVKMLDAALKNMPNLRLVEASQNHHNLETLREITSHYKDDVNHEFFLLFGADVVEQMQTWDNFEEIQKLAQVISIGRNGEPADLHFAHAASSKKIREQIANNEQPENLNKKVLEYIHEHKLYQN